MSFTGLVFGFVHLIQPRRFADFNSRCSPKLSSVLTHASFGSGLSPFTLFSHRSWRIEACDKALIGGPFDLLALVPYCSAVLASQSRNENKTSTSESFEFPLGLSTLSADFELPM